MTTVIQEKLTPYDPAAALVDEEEMAYFMADALETGDAGHSGKSQRHGQGRNGYRFIA
jgi:DNA-binding phage protein